MEKVAFTPEGVSAKTAELYALSDHELCIEARAVGTDFKSWFRNNFTLEPSQEEYLNEVPPSFLLFWGYLFGSAFIGRRPVVMASLPDKPRRTKQGNTMTSVSGSYTPEQNGNPAVFEFDGEVAVVFQQD